MYQLCHFTAKQNYNNNFDANEKKSAVVSKVVYKCAKQCNENDSQIVICISVCVYVRMEFQRCIDFFRSFRLQFIINYRSNVIEFNIPN